MSNVQDAGATPNVYPVFADILDPRMDVELILPTQTLSQEPTRLGANECTIAFF